MKIKVKCPRCKSPQKFGIQRNERKDGLVELFIKCTICRWYKLILVDSADRIKLLKDIEKLKVRALKDPSLNKMLEAKIERFKNE